MDERGNYDDNCDGLNSPAAYVVIYNDLLMKMMDIITMIMIVWNYLNRVKILMVMMISMIVVMIASPVETLIV